MSFKLPLARYADQLKGTHSILMDRLSHPQYHHHHRRLFYRISKTKKHRSNPKRPFALWHNGLKTTQVSAAGVMTPLAFPEFLIYPPCRLSHPLFQVSIPSGTESEIGITRGHRKVCISSRRLQHITSNFLCMDAVLGSPSSRRHHRD
jgi:hypothetical protein